MSNVMRPGFPDFNRKVLGKNAATVYPGNPKLGGAPVVFSASVTLAPGLSAVLNAQTLQSGFRTPYFIDEIHVSMFTEAKNLRTLDGAHTPTGLSGLVRLLFQTGKYQFSADAVPAGLLAPMFGSDYGIVDAGNSDLRSFSCVRWALPKPLFMPAGDVVLCNVSVMDNAALVLLDSPDVTVTITYIGRLVPQGYIAPTREIPWLAWWGKSMFSDAAITIPNTYADATTRLRNPFKIPVHVQRFTQRTYRKNILAVPTLALVQYDETNNGGQLYNTSRPYETIAIQDSRGYVITRDFVPVGDVFDVARHAWSFGRELSPREQFNMQMTTKGIALAAASTDYDTYVGVVGYRKEAP